MRERYVPTGTVRLQIVSFNRLNGCLGSLKDAQYNAWTHDTPYSQQTAPQAIESAEYRSVGLSVHLAAVYRWIQLQTDAGERRQFQWMAGE